MSLMQTEVVGFHGQDLVTANLDGVIFVAMKPVVEGMGMDWKSQFSKIKHRRDRYGYGDITIPLPSGGPQTMLCIPLKKLNGWLFSVNPAKIPDPEVRTRVELYQEECFEALYSYWHKGFAARADVEPAAEALSGDSEQSRANRLVDAERIFRSFGRAADAALRMSPGARIAANVAALRVTGIDVLAILAESGFVPPEEARHSQEKTADDEIIQKILGWLDSHNRPYVTTRDVWVEVLGRDEVDFTNSRRVWLGTLMREIGYIQRRVRIDGVRQASVWYRPEVYTAQFH